MRYISAIASSFALLCVLGSWPATAFQQESVGSSFVSSDAASQTKETKPADPLQGLTGTESSAATSSDQGSGTKLSIPGLGTVGVLPKMDFGLELLYGANTPTEATTEQDDEPDDLRIRGSIKHRF